MKITNDRPTGKAAQTSRYQQLFSQLTPENNCLVFDEIKEMERVAQALDAWAHRHVKGGKVTTTKRYPADGSPLAERPPTWATSAPRLDVIWRKSANTSAASVSIPTAGSEC